MLMSKNVNNDVSKDSPIIIITVKDLEVERVVFTLQCSALGWQSG